jgi:hypothetical protein
MTATRRRLMALTVLAGLLGLGCNPFVAPYFLLFGAHEKVQPEFKLTAGPPGHDEDKPVKVVLLCSAGPGVQSEFLGVERTIAQMLRDHLLRVSQANKEKLELVPVAQVEQWKAKHPAWQTLKAEQIAKHFGADYVVDLEITSMSLYEPGSHNQFFRGNTQITVTVREGRPGSDAPVYRREYTCNYPATRGPVHVDMDTPPQKFKEDFLAYVVTDLTWLFCTHLKEEEYHRPN